MTCSAVFLSKQGARIGIMGGTFDPIHVGHLLLAEQVYDALELDGVLFVPAGNPSFKQDRKVSSAQDRLAMVELAVADNPHFAVSDMEVRREGVTYTVDTLEALGEELPSDVRLFFIMGSDTLATLHHWRSADRLAGLATFVGVDRPGDVTVSDDELGVLARAGFDVEMVQVPAFEVSSSEVRRRLAAGKSVRYLMPLAAIEYLEEHGMYRGETSEEGDAQHGQA